MITTARRTSLLLRSTSNGRRTRRPSLARRPKPSWQRSRKAVARANAHPSGVASSLEELLIDVRKDHNSNGNSSNNSNNVALEQQLEIRARVSKREGATIAERSVTSARTARRLIEEKPDRRDQRECWLVRTRMAFPSLEADFVLRARSVADVVSSPRSQLQSRVDSLRCPIAMPTSMMRSL